MRKLLLSLTLISYFTGYAQMNYSFETAQGYTVGNIAGQNAWGGTAAAYLGTVSTEQANPGTQSLKITGNNGTVHTAAGAISPTVTVNGPIVTILYNAYFTTSTVAGDECDFFFSPQSPAQSTINARMRFDFQGNIHVVDADPLDPLSLIYVDTNANFTRNAWNTYKIQLDFTTSEAKYYQNGTLIYTGGVVGGTLVGNLAITSDNYNSAAYFDGIQVVSGVLGTSDVKKLSYKMYPNPTSDFLVIESTDKITSIEIYDFAGKKLNVSLNENKVDLRSLPIGVYILNINTPKGKITDRVVKK